MATTTNYSWTTPDDTDLVKDGAAAIRTLGSSIDTSVKALSPGTTAGDLDYYTTSTAKARIAIGTAGQVLQVNSGATAPEWATPSSGGMTLLSTTSLSGATTTISAISGSYNILLGIVTGMTNATADGQYRIAPNGTTNISHNGYVSDAATPTWTTTSASYLLLSTGGGEAPDRTSANNAITFIIYNYASATAHKSFTVNGYYNVINNASDKGFFNFGGIATNSAITSLQFSNGGGNLSTGTVLLYGVK